MDQGPSLPPGPVMGKRTRGLGPRAAATATRASLLQYVVPGSILLRRIGLTADFRRLDLAAGMRHQPRGPVRPPASVVPLRLPPPGFRILRAVLVGPVGALAAWRVDDPRDMPAGGQDVAHFSAGKLGDPPC